MTFPMFLILVEMDKQTPLRFRAEFEHYTTHPTTYDSVAQIASTCNFVGTRWSKWKNGPKSSNS